jgi:hypothetical protein
LAAVARYANLVDEDMILRSGAMGLLFFDAGRRLATLSEKGDPLEAIAPLVPWESFRTDIEAVVLTPEEAKKSRAGGKPLDAIVLFRMLALQALYNLSDEVSDVAVDDLSVDLACAHAGCTIVVILGHARVRVIEQSAGEVGRIATVHCRGRSCRSTEQVGRDIDAYGFESDPGDQCTEVVSAHWSAGLGRDPEGVGLP